MVGCMHVLVGFCLMTDLYLSLYWCTSRPQHNVSIIILCQLMIILHGILCLQRNRRGGLRSKYVDVLNPGGTKSSSGGPPPPGPPAIMSGPPQPFSGTFFVPQQPPGKTTCGGLHVGTIIVYKMNCSQYITCKATLCVCVCVCVYVCVCVHCVCWY